MQRIRNSSKRLRDGIGQIEKVQKSVCASHCPAKKYHRKKSHSYFGIHTQSRRAPSSREGEPEAKEIRLVPTDAVGPSLPRADRLVFKSEEVHSFP